MWEEYVWKCTHNNIILLQVCFKTEKVVWCQSNWAKMYNVLFMWNHASISIMHTQSFIPSTENPVWTLYFSYPLSWFWKSVGSQGICGLLCVCLCPCVPAAFVFLSVFYSCTERRVFPLSPPPLFNIYLTFCLSSDYWNDCKLVWNNRLLQSFVSEKIWWVSKNTILQMVFLLFLYVCAVHSSQLYSWDDNKRLFVKIWCG